ncbi:sec-independent protein translocase protein TatC [Vibrio cholerae]|nr:sec-independent protein translocase protein TatC [Vibrio cholerae]
MPVAIILLCWTGATTPKSLSEKSAQSLTDFAF